MFCLLLDLSQAAAVFHIILCRTYTAALDATEADAIMMGDGNNGNKPNVGSFILKPNQRVMKMLDGWLELASPTKTEQFVSTILRAVGGSVSY